MNFIERVKKVRDDTGLNQREFAESLGLNRDQYANFEYDRLKNPSTKNPTIKAICDKYRVDETWLRTGEGEPYIPLTREAEIEEITDRLFSAEENDFRYQLIKTISEMSTAQIELLKDIAKKINENK